MPELSVVIPHYPYSENIDAILQRCLKSLTDYEELILVVNDKIGFAKAVNWGLKVARKEFIAVVSNDIVLQEGTLKDLCDPEGVTSPLLNGDTPPRGLWGCCFVIPRWVYEKISGLDENFELGYYEDDDYAMRLKEAGIPMITKNNVKIFSEGGLTIKSLPERGEAYIKNQEYFKKKWPGAPIHG